jgi:hypothetical protein
MGDENRHGRILIAPERADASVPLDPWVATVIHAATRVDGGKNWS